MAQSHPEIRANILITRGALYQNMAMMDNGTVYVSIHTKDFPNGEIRGNSFVGIDRIFPDFTDNRWK